MVFAETSDGAILFVFGDEAAVAANKSAEAAQAPAPEPEAAYEEARTEKVHEGAAAAGLTQLAPLSSVTRVAGRFLKCWLERTPCMHLLPALERVAHMVCTM